MLLVCVLDIIVTSNYWEGIERLKRGLMKEFEMKELGRLKYFLGIEVAHSESEIFISQQKYLTNLLMETCKLGSKPAGIPIEFKHKLGDNLEDPMVNKSSYQSLEEKLIYLFHTRPNIASAVSVISQFMHNPKEPYLRAIYKIIQYLKSTPRKGILFKKGKEMRLEAYTDVDYAGTVLDR